MFRHDLTGQVISGYIVHQRIGDGTYGAIYKASHPQIDHPVVIKVLLPHHMRNLEALQRFEAEAVMIAKLNAHPNVVPIYDYWREEEGAYLVLKWLGGGTLRDLLKRCGALAPEQAAYVLVKLADALEAAHKIGIIHRDLKASNVLFDTARGVYLADFGIAKQQGANITAPGAILGTPAYLAPEQIRAQTISPQTDVYALGIMLYEMLMGERPFQAKQAVEVLMKHLTEPVPLILLRNSQLQNRVNTIIQHAVAKSPSERYESPSQMARDFRDAVRLHQTA